MDEISPCGILKMWLTGRATMAGQVLTANVAEAIFDGFEGRDGLERLQAWLSAEMSARMNATRASAVCAVIDFVLGDLGSADFWDALQQANLEIVESGWSAALRATANRSLGEHETQKAEWLELSVSWNGMRTGLLKDEHLRRWSRTV